ncbi:MAG: fumarylacetoacetate hydrolase family protein, partial [Candidatus Neomarinimicrobiota bacterium]|nr:fumarylacetoacetate hydrolase family protein [Candidatus Neomarinimicrobiota bacterium]
IKPMPKNNDKFSVVLANNQIPVRNIYAVGRNYPAHAKEMGSTVNNEPIFFQKSLTSLQTGAKIIIPRDRNIHHELEVVVLIGTPGEFIDENKAIDHVTGLALGLDLTDRDLQNELKKQSLPWFLSKSFKGSAVVSEFKTCTNDIWGKEFWLKRNEVIVQRGKMEQMVFSITNLIEYLSARMPLLKGDLIFTGTPEGVGRIEQGDNLELGIAQEILMEIEVA